MADERSSVPRDRPLADNVGGRPLVLMILIQVYQIRVIPYLVVAPRFADQRKNARLRQRLESMFSVFLEADVAGGGTEAPGGT